MDISTVEVVKLTSSNEPAILHTYAANKNEYLVVNASGMYGSAEPLYSDGFQDYFFAYLASGEANINGKHMKAGQAVLLNPHTPLKLTHIKGDLPSLYWVHFTGFGVNSVIKSCNLKNGIPADAETSENTIQEFLQLGKESLMSEYCFRISAAARFTTLMISLCGKRENTQHKTDQDNSNSSENSETKTESKKSKRSADIAVALDYIHENYNKDFSIETLANLSRLSESRFRTVFREKTGFSPLDYIIRLRIEKARELISEGSMSLREVAEAVGYDDQLYFSRVFKKRTGVIPSEYVAKSSD